MDMIRKDRLRYAPCKRVEFRMRKAKTRGSKSILNRTLTIWQFLFLQASIGLLIFPYMWFNHDVQEQLCLKNSGQNSKDIKPKQHVITNLLNGDVSGFRHSPDPLDDMLLLEGFPTEPLTIESARLCDEQANVMFSDSWKCKKDPTCKQCTVSAQESFYDLSNAFNRNELYSERKADILQKFAFDQKINSKKKTVVLLGVNYGQLYLLLNWACAVDHLNLNPTELAVIVPTDLETYNIVKELGFYATSVAWLDFLDKKIKETYTGSAMSGDHSRINNLILLVANELVQLGFSVVIHDVDIVWNKNIIPYLENAVDRRDLLGMIAPYWSAKGTINSGFIYVNPTKKSKILMQSLVNLAPLKVTSDQELWNIVLRHYYFGQINYRILPQTIFYKYSGHHATPPDKNIMLVFHSVGNGKRPHMDYFGLWFFNEQCPYYNKEVDEASQKVRENVSKFYKDKKP